MIMAIGVPDVLELKPGDGLTEADANEAPVVGFNLSGSLAPLICFRAWRREVDKYRNLADALGPDQPIYAASPPRGAVKADFPRGAEEWAKLFMEALGPLLDREPLLLGGWSYAGVIALQIAESLAAQGRPPALVNLFDSTMPVAKPRGDRHKRGKFHKFIVEVNRGLEIPNPEAQNEFFRAYARGQAIKLHGRGRRQIQSLTRKLLGRHPALPLSPPKKAGHGRSDLLKRAIRVSYLKSRPAPSTLPVALYWTEQSRAKLGDSSLGWCIRMLGDFRCHPIDGNHETLFDRENIDRFAASLGNELRQAARHSSHRSG